MPTWDALFRNLGVLWREPEKEVVDMIPLFKQKGVSRVCDLGCGTGRHTVLLTKNGFNTTGVDISSAGLELTCAALLEQNVEAQLVEASQTCLPFSKGAFDAIITIFTLDHALRADVMKSKEEIYRCLSRDGLLFVCVLSTSDGKYGKGKRIEDGTFYPGVGPDGDIGHHFFTRSEMETLLSGFCILSLEEKSHTFEVMPGEPVQNIHWYALAEKQ